MKREDRILFEAVLSPGQEMGRLSLAAVKRGGLLLLALPLERRLARATLALYQPQRLKGRLFRSGMRFLVFSGLHRLLPRVEVVVGDKGLFSGFDGKVSLDGFGFLLGSGGSEFRNLIGLADFGGELCVVKAGRGEAAEVVREESRRMDEFSRCVQGVPVCYEVFDIEEGAAYIAERVGGKSPRGKLGDERVFGLLGDWLEAGEAGRVSELPCWQRLEGVLGEAEMARFVRLAKAEVLSPVMHGDFAPWNIKVDVKGGVRVLDWEFAEQRGMPGWDWLHYHVQRYLLVRDESAEVVVRKCCELLGSKEMEAYFKRAGLAGMEDEVLGSYLYFSGRVYDYPRDDLIKVWEGKERFSEGGGK